MKKVVLNGCFGGFGLSQKAYEYLGLEWDGFGHCDDFDRDDKTLVACVEALGEEANGDDANLIIEEYDDENYTYYIDDYDGLETLVTEPLVREDKLRDKSLYGIMDYLSALGINVRRTS